MKKLYDYVENYKSIASHLLDKYYICTEKLKSYLDEIQNIYLKSKDINIPGSSIYNYILLDFENVNIENDRWNITCKEIIQEKPFSQGIQRLYTSHEGDSAQTLKLPEPVVVESSVLPRREGEKGLAVTDVAVEEANSSDKVSMDSVPVGDESESVIPTKVGTIGATLAGSSLFLIMMYMVKKHIFIKYYHFVLIFILHYYENLLKTNNYIFKYYTPLGSWIKTKLLRRNKLMENMKRNNYELLLNDIENSQAGLKDTMYHIRYNSSSNQ
ncbi:hypothetical protein PCYB_004720 [Plasmodium cynomolgi strain B]|uniref:CYIR protein n=1 Tax=Plasmodium cynomolgi (strain B) TaxID=1120755 RepID=K6UNR1_PLACD|nr:hypothetical protein PCYB_004720 [Plasmodium cynomolgi strain B]GAB69723.1 hypothetical protein PCYB_004720 [Plasmodium cynomolgi strain B]